LEALLAACPLRQAAKASAGVLEVLLDQLSGSARAIFTALLPSGEPVGHIEISQIWPYLSSRLSRVLVAPDRRRLGIGGGMVSRASAFSFDTHHVDRIDLGVDADKATFINACRKRSVFSDEELAKHWEFNPNNRPFIVNFLYVHSFSRRPNLKELKASHVVTDAPRGFEALMDRDTRIRQ
jgi:hypothetical protein